MKSVNFNIFIVILLSVTLYSHSSYSMTTSQCLGKEEYYIYKNKITGPIYHLNRELISFFINQKKMIIPADLQQRLCSMKNSRTNSNTFPSLSILEYVLTSKNKNRLNVSYEPFIHFLFHYTQNIQKMTKDPQCLNKYVPYLKKFKDYIRYAGLDIKLKSINLTTLQYRRLFKKIKNPDKILFNCKK